MGVWHVSAHQSRNGEKLANGGGIAIFGKTTQIPKKVSVEKDPRGLAVIYCWRNWGLLLIYVFGLAFTAGGGLFVAAVASSGPLLILPVSLLFL